MTLRNPIVFPSELTLRSLRFALIPPDPVNRPRRSFRCERRTMRPGVVVAEEALLLFELRCFRRLCESRFCPLALGRAKDKRRTAANRCRVLRGGKSAVDKSTAERRRRVPVGVVCGWVGDKPSCPINGPSVAPAILPFPILNHNRKGIVPGPSLARAASAHAGRTHGAARSTPVGKQRILSPAQSRTPAHGCARCPRRLARFHATRANPRGMSIAMETCRAGQVHTIVGAVSRPHSGDRPEQHRCPAARIHQWDSVFLQTKLLRLPPENTRPSPSEPRSKQRSVLTYIRRTPQQVAGGQIRLHGLPLVAAPTSWSLTSAIPSLSPSPSWPVKTRASHIPRVLHPGPVAYVRRPTTGPSGLSFGSREARTD